MQSARVLSLLACMHVTLHGPDKLATFCRHLSTGAPTASLVPGAYSTKPTQPVQCSSTSICYSFKLPDSAACMLSVGCSSNCCATKSQPPGRYIGQSARRNLPNSEPRHIAGQHGCLVAEPRYASIPLLSNVHVAMLMASEMFYN